MRFLSDTHSLVWAVNAPELLGDQARAMFDRILAAQCLSEGIPLVTKDAHLALYGINTIW